MLTKVQANEFLRMLQDYDFFGFNEGNETEWLMRATPEELRSLMNELEDCPQNIKEFVSRLGA